MQEEKDKSVMSAYYEVEDMLYGDKSMSLITQAAIIWGALTVINKHGDIDWDTQLRSFGEFMSKQSGVR